MVKNTLAYYDTELITAVNCFIVDTHLSFLSKYHACWQILKQAFENPINLKFYCFL
jgi:hypothetical protein